MEEAEAHVKSFDTEKFLSTHKLLVEQAAMIKKMNSFMCKCDDIG